MTDLPPDVVDEAERLTRLARAADDPGEADAYRRDRAQRLAEHDYVARVRDDDTLVCHPAEWVDDDGLIRTDRVADTDHAVERPLDAPDSEGDWETIDAHNRALADRVADEHGQPHGANAAAFADYMSNHHAARVEDATATQIETFLADYYPRNAWPTDEQRAVVQRSLKYLFQEARRA